MKDNKSHGIPPKLLLEVVEQFSTNLATVFNLSLQEGVLPLEWKEVNTMPLFFLIEKQVRKPQTSELNIGDLQSIRKTN